MLGSIWYEGVPGFRRCHILQQSLLIARLCVLYPYYCLMYMLAPHTNTGHTRSATLVILTSAVNRSIGSTTGFHNHREGPYYHKEQAALRHYANQAAHPFELVSQCHIYLQWFNARLA